MKVDTLGMPLDGRDDAARPTVGDARQENFIPYSQIAPLLRPGMTLLELGDAIRARLDPSFWKHKIRMMENGNIRAGVEILKPGTPGGVAVPDRIIA